MKKRFFSLMGLLFCMAVIFVLSFSIVKRSEGAKEGFLTVEALSDKIKETSMPECSEERKEVLPALVKIHGTVASGSGSIFGVTADNVIIVTAGHVLEGNEELYVTFFHGKEIPCEILEISDRVDVGFVTVKASDLSKEDIEILRRVRIETEVYENLEKNALLFMADISGEESRMIEGGVVEKSKMLPEFSVPMIYADGAASKGMSGSAVFDEDGYFIGILVAATEYGELAILPVTEIDQDKILR